MSHALLVNPKKLLILKFIFSSLKRMAIPVCHCPSHQADPERMAKIIHDQYRFNVDCMNANKTIQQCIAEREAKIAACEVELNEVRERIKRMEQDIGTILINYYL